MDRQALRKHFDQLEAAFISDAARLANEMQKQFSGMTRTHALKEADRLVRKYGLGTSLAT